MGYPMNEAQTMNFLARRIHAWAIRKKFYSACETCGGAGTVTGEKWFYDIRDHTAQTEPQVEKAMSFCEKNPGAVIECPICHGRGSQIVPHEFYKQLMHMVGELDEAFQLTRKHTLEPLIEFTGRPGVVPIEGYDVKDPCKPAVPDKNLPGHPALAVEFADVTIRVLDTARWLGLDVGQALMDKLDFNDTRPEKHVKLH